MLFCILIGCILYVGCAYMFVIKWHVKYINKIKFGCRVLSRWMRIPFLPLNPVYRSREYRERYSSLQNVMTGACSSISVITAHTALQLAEARNGELDTITNNLTALANDQEKVLDQRPLLSYSLLQFVYREVSIYFSRTILVAYGSGKHLHNLQPACPFHSRLVSSRQVISIIYVLRHNRL